MQMDFWLLFPMSENRFITKARLVLRADRIGLRPLSYKLLSPLRSDLDVIEVPVTLNRVTRVVRVDGAGTLIQINLQADVDPNNPYDVEATGETIVKKLVPTAYKYVNRFLDIIRFVTDDPRIGHVGPGYPEVLLVVRPSQNGISPLVALLHSDRPAPEQEASMDSLLVGEPIRATIGKDETIELPVGDQCLSPADIQRIRTLCGDESAFPPWDNLLASARHSWHQGACREALLSAHTAIEARIDNLIYLSLSDKNLTRKRIEDFLSDTSFKYKLTICLPALCGVSIDSSLLDRILNLHRRRNDVVHLGELVFHREASRALSTAKTTLAALEGTA